MDILWHKFPSTYNSTCCSHYLVY